MPCGSYRPKSFDSAKDIIFIKQVKIKSRLISGENGVVYLVTYKGTKSVLKIEYMNSCDYSNMMLRIQRDFRNWISSLNSRDKLYFMDTYKYALRENNKKILVNSILEYKNGIMLNSFNRKYNSIDKRKSIPKLTSVFIEIMYLLFIMQNDGWYHNDLHSRNIICSPTKKPYLQLDLPNRQNIKIKSNGYTVAAIDYGSMVHINDIDEVYKKHKTGIHGLILDLAFDCNRLYIINYIAICIHEIKYKTRKRYTLIETQHYFYKRYPTLFNNVIRSIKSYINVVMERCDALFGNNMDKYKVKYYITKHIKDNLKAVKNNKFLPRIHWILYYIDTVALIEYPKEYCNLWGTVKSSTIIDKNLLYKILFSVTERDQEDTLYTICNSVNK